jgi:hypothetical protein
MPAGEGAQKNGDDGVEKPGQQTEQKEPGQRYGYH